MKKLARLVQFTPQELAEFNAALSRIVVHGERPRPGLLALSGVEAPPKPASN